MSVSSIIEWIQTLHSSSSDHERLHDAESQIIKTYERPDIDSLSLTIINRAPDETTRFFALQMLQEGICLRWQEWDQHRKSEIKEAVLTLVGDERLATHLTQQKLASVIASIASSDWPTEWTRLIEIFLFKAKQRPLESTAVFLGVIQQLAEVSLDGSSRIIASIKRRREISQTLADEISGIILIIKTATDVITSFDSDRNWNYKDVLYLARLSIEALNSLSSSVSISALISENVDQFVISVLLKFPECQAIALNLMSTLAIGLGMKKNHQQPAASIPLQDLLRFTEGITELTTTCCSQKFGLKVSTYVGQIQVATIVKDFLEKSSEPLINRLPSDVLHKLWTDAVWRLISHPSLSIATIGISASSFIINRVCLSAPDVVPPSSSSSPSPSSALPDWLDIRKYIGLLYWRCIRVGDPSINRYIESLSSCWGSISSGGWPVDEFVRILRELVQTDGCPIESTWWSESMSMAALEAQVELDDEEEDVARSGQLFASRYAALKSTVVIPLVALWSHSAETRGDVMNVLSCFGDIIMAAQCVRDTVTFDPLQTLQPFICENERIPERLKPWLSPCYVLLDCLYLPVEAIAQKIKVDLLISGIKMEAGSEDWVRTATALFEKILSIEFQISTMTHFLEIRRLDFLGVSSAFLSGIGFNISEVLDLIFQKIPLSEAEHSSSVVLINGTVENWRDQSYLIRRRALYALMSLCQGGSPEALGPYLESIVTEVQSRLNSNATNETERALLVDSIMSATAATQTYSIQERFATQLTQSHVEMILSSKFKELTDSSVWIECMAPDCSHLYNHQPNLIQFLFGQPNSITVPSASDTLAENRRAIARVIGQIETILKRAVIPGDQSVLESGGYLTQSPTPFRLTPIELDELIQKNVDVSPHLKFRIRHPLSSLVSNLLVPILKFTRTYQLLWTKQTLLYAPWLEPLLAVGEEEWQAIEGGNAIYLGAPNKLKIIVEQTFPFSPGMIADKVYLSRRHGFHIRTSLYRCLGEMARVTDGFYGQSNIQSLLGDLMKDSYERLSICHLGVQLEHLWGRVFDHKNLSNLLASNYPVLGFLKVTLVPLLEGVGTRLERELIEINVVRHQLMRSCSGAGGKEVEFQRRMALYTLRHNATTGCATSVLQIICSLLHVTGTAVVRPVDLEQTDDNIVKREDGTTRPPDLLIMKLKQIILGDDILIASLLRLCVRLVSFPNTQVISEAYRILRAYVKQSTKNFSPLHPCTPKLVTAVYQSCLAAIFEPPPFDPLLLSDPAPDSQTVCSPLQEFLSGKDPSNSLLNQIVSSLYESLHGLHRYYSQLCSKVQKNPEDPNSIVICPQLYDCILALHKLPHPISSDDLEAFTTYFLPKDNAKGTKSVLRQIVNMNLTPGATLCDLPPSVLSSRSKASPMEIPAVDDWDRGAALASLFS